MAHKGNILLSAGIRAIYILIYIEYYSFSFHVTVQDTNLRLPIWI